MASHGHTTELQPPSRTRVFVSGLDHVIDVGGGCFEYVFFVNRQGPTGSVREAVEISIIGPRDSLPDAIGKLLMALGRQVFVRSNGSITVMH